MSPELSDVSGAALLGIESTQTKPRAMTQPSWRDRRRQGAISVYTESFVAVKEIAIDIDWEFESEKAHCDSLLYTVGGLIMYHFETTVQWSRWRHILSLIACSMIRTLGSIEMTAIER